MLCSICAGSQVKGNYVSQSVVNPGMLLAIFMGRLVDWQAQQRSDVVCRTYDSVSAWKYSRYVCQKRGDTTLVVKILETLTPSAS
ncbi:uncharacterized protein ARMOST_12068 [Armillaria ostoyae]|uniref:Uncharacterized protein n=1 Tax=Armillaria ostoyae TaxID=47428 RepID=A0A284RIW2_ARMOS|nr:uncharacterized protein ARMOST_12068 [Armillaria ostoyae]